MELISWFDSKFNAQQQVLKYKQTHPRKKYSIREEKGSKYGNHSNKIGYAIYANRTDE